MTSQPATAPTSLDLAVVGGDGIGPEVVAEGLRVLRAVTEADGVEVRTTDYDLGAKRWHGTHQPAQKSIRTMPSSTVSSWFSAVRVTDADLDALRGHDAILLGAIGDPSVPSGVLERGVLLPLRFALDHCVNLRPSTLFPGAQSPLDLARVAPDGFDFVVVREGTEGPYVGNGGAPRCRWTTCTSTRPRSS